MEHSLAGFKEICLVDFEFRQADGERPVPLCLVARDWRSGRTDRVWLDESPTTPPFDTGPNSLFVAYYASAELGCFLALDWPMPARVLDLYAEFRCLTSGLTVPCGNGLLGALTYFGLDGVAATEKDSMRRLAQREGPHTAEERRALLAYCESDVDALTKLLPVMLPQIDLPRAMLRGRYMAAAANMEWTGIPIDAEALALLRTNWDRIKSRLIATVDAAYVVFVPLRQRRLNPNSAFGAAVIRKAKEWNLDPFQLAEVVDHIWADQRALDAESLAARRAARKRTGLSARRIEQWEDSGRDHSTFPRLDTTARDLAGEFPALGIGPGPSEDSPDETDWASRLWDVLRSPNEKLKTKHDSEILRRAAELASTLPPAAADFSDPMSFSADRWAQYLNRKGIPWPRLESGALALDENTFREMSRAYPVEIAPIRELRHALGQLRLQELAVGSDKRNRCLLSAFGSRTGRNQPSNSRYIFGPSVWLRGLIRPAEGWAVAYVDYEQQEFGIAAALSGDDAMRDAYRSGDPYLAFAKQAGAVPPDGGKETHQAQRERFKVLSLAVQYGMGPDSLARRLDESPARGRELLSLHRQTYPRYWRWSDAVEMTAMLTGRLQAAFGWTVYVGPNANPRSLRNFPLQANGAEMLRLACIFATERGISVCGPIHDALLVEGPADEIDDVVTNTKKAMREASELVLPGFPLRTEAKIVRYPDRYSDPRGEQFWQTVWKLIDELDGSLVNESDGSTGATRRVAPVLPPSNLISSLFTPIKDPPRP